MTDEQKDACAREIGELVLVNLLRHAPDLDRDGCLDVGKSVRMKVRVILDNHQPTTVLDNQGESG